MRYVQTDQTSSGYTFIAGAPAFITANRTYSNTLPSLNLKGGIGLITPPIGSVLFVGTAIGKISVTEALRTIWPFYFAALAVLFIVVYVPQLSLWLPGLLK